MIVAARVRRAMNETPAHLAVGILVGGTAAGLLSLPLAFVLGTLGGGWGEQLLGRLGVLLGIALTLIAVPAASFAAGGAAGGGLAWGLGWIVGRLRKAGGH